MDELTSLDATAQAALVRSGAASPTELLDATLDRIDEANPTLNAVIHRLDDFARAQIAAPEGLPDGPFRGVPFLLKDFAAELHGTPFTEGTEFSGDHVSSGNQTLTDRFLAAGLVICGKTNVPEFAILPTAEPRRFGPSHNPWNLDHSTGGSSGGSAAAVASGMVAAAHANDGGGSIRIPASCCGLVGLKPTRARVPLGPRYGDVMSGLVAEHVVTRSVRDTAGMLDAIAGPEVGDPYCAPPQATSYVDAAASDPPPLRVALATQGFGGELVHGDCVAAAEAAAHDLEALGHHVTVDSFSVDDAYVGQFINLWGAGNAWIAANWEDRLGRAMTPDDVEPLTWALVELGRTLPASAYLVALQALQQKARMVGQFFVGYDVLVTPTLGEPPAVLGTFDSPPDNPLAGLFRAASYIPFTPIFNVTGQPAISLPLSWSADGLPVGVQFAGRFGDEATLLSLAGQLERAHPWSARRPPAS